LERGVRTCVTEALSTAERALSVASAKQTMAEAEVKKQLARLQSLREEMITLAH
jgi:hypothetical protein